jgi:hypothetical protein
MAYSPITKASDFFNTKLWTGTGAENAITGVGFQPDWVWIKNRAAAENHKLYDAVRGATKNIYSNLSNAEGTDTQSLKSFDSDGFTLGTEGALNANGQNIVGWNWKANGSGSANTDGSINSTVSVNTTSGFSIVTYTGNDTNSTVGHGLGKVPKIIMVKQLNGTNDWRVYTSMTGNTSQMSLNTNAAPDSGNTTMWNSTTPTANLFYLGTHGSVNGGSDTYIAYCFAEIQGYSAFGKYRGNAVATDGTFVNCGFRPSMVIQKRLDGSENWYIFDEKRDGFNQDNEYLFPNLTQAESSGINRVNLLSNGFKLMTTDGGNNANGGPYLYMAFGQTLVGSNDVPVNAR